MRRLFFCLLALTMTGMLQGCRHTAGVCDCEYDDPCASRSPWIQHHDGALPESIKQMPKAIEPPKI